MERAPDAGTLAQVLRRLPTAVVLIDDEGRVVWANDVVHELTKESPEGAERLFGAVQQAVGGTDAPDAVTVASVPTDRGLFERELWTTAATPSLRIVTFQPDAPAALGASAADEHSRRLEAMLAHTDDLITLLSADGTIRASNAAAGRLTGFSGGGVNGRNALDFVHPDDVAVAADALTAVLSAPGRSTRAQVRLRFADGAWHDVEASVTNLIDVPP